MLRWPLVGLAVLLGACFLDPYSFGDVPSSTGEDGGADGDHTDADDVDRDASPDTGADGDADTDTDADPDGDACVPSEELCNSLDDDCDGEVDENPVDGLWSYRDDDNDGWGDDSEAVFACRVSEGYVTVGGDCDDQDSSTNPDGSERCNGQDDDCNGLVDEEACEGCDTETWGRGTYLFCSEDWLYGDDAAADCEARGYTLAIINDADEQAWLWGLASRLDSSDWWIGLTDSETEGVYRWPDGSVAWDDGALLYTNWRDDPLGHHDSEDCVELDIDNGGRWADDGCDESEPYVCELP